MSRNRVEKLETTVRELESTVDGLTEELVEAKERIRVLEAALDADSPTRVPERRVEETTQDTPEAEPDEIEAATAEADESEADEETDETEESRSDDIIVA